TWRAVWRAGSVDRSPPSWSALADCEIREADPEPAAAFNARLANDCGSDLDPEAVIRENRRSIQSRTGALILLDTNVSGPLQKTRTPSLAAWFLRTAGGLAWPRVGVAEIAFGVGTTRPEDRAVRLEQGLTSWRRRFADRIFPSGVFAPPSPPL